ncbi:BlaI/MecI/CopY family transcriptional regulator [Spiractinospora alimapuensis]|uniref:BlaI/MecI/CopY family transcriptional regulator n=1 Tax=Spiractinospora alimapuensis TaxID=2820884 RepID=UPI001F3E61BE|nr:BlaI/MecI/CopY family transcriptional regulator [Spiractinospora alimapuensis]QVQ50767.1 BlaI/MecI/CopY family transcriptional regulator [Spiractinospora alimapuensis]
MSETARRTGLGPLEAAVLDVLWDATAPMSVRQVVDTLDDREPAYTTIATVLENLRRKERVERERVGRLWYYRAMSNRAAHAAQVMHGALSASDDAHDTLLRFVDEMAPEDVDVLRGLLADVPRDEAR